MSAHEERILAAIERKVYLLGIVERERDNVVAHEILIAVADGVNALAVVEVLAVVHSSHRVNQYAYRAAVRAAVEFKCIITCDFVLVAAVNSRLVLAVYIDIRSVVDIRNAQLARVIYLFELRLVVDHAAVLTEIFHALGQGNAVALAEIVEVAHQRRALVKLDFAYRLELRRCGKLGLGQVLSLEQKLSDCIICGRVVAPFGQQRAVVVARDRRLIFFVAVRSGSEAEVRATVEHVEIEARVNVKKIFNLARNAV